ncbi:hypothetical protein GUITHDRAFT_133615 [Guillardia theta CCMP2712]|uniref:Uncharacterized protein n=1 Tax=Guillardia theta (strain CCMP2712) TaxID=905079 RepID=L1JWG5_GUITC|nr:hypothetical protein GUITHDRAFT_133615 [Guillardia theta CCMP2712]EKX52545.1 hypothetical protein GUITHDRAFT_133615 [Guillardia theta CCMP2712]|eukprot:XP_005839525.1 hypothetical protein GUITHDRAFT_133615 [Guillardia theta CCMP2712]
MDKIAGAVISSKLSSASESLGIDKFVSSVEEKFDKFGTKKENEAEGQRSENAEEKKKSFIPDALKSSDMKAKERLHEKRAEREKMAEQMRKEMNIKRQVPEETPAKEQEQEKGAISSMMSGVKSGLEKTADLGSTAGAKLLQGLSGMSSKVKSTIMRSPGQEEQEGEKVEDRRMEQKETEEAAASTTPPKSGPSSMGSKLQDLKETASSSASKGKQLVTSGETCGCERLEGDEERQASR